MTKRRTASPRALARTIAVLGLLEGSASVWGHLRIPGRLVVPTDAAATAANILGNESLFRLGILLSALAVCFNVARTAVSFHLFQPAGRIAALLAAFFGVITIGLQAAGILVQLPVLPVLEGGSAFGAVQPESLQAAALLLMRWSGHVFNFYLAFFGICCILVGNLIVRSTFLPRILGVLLAIAGLGYSTYLWPPLAIRLHPWNLALGVGEVVLGLYLLVFGLNAERWTAQARAARELDLSVMEAGRS